MTAADLYHNLIAHGFTLTAAADRLLITPASRLDDGLRIEIRQHKAELLALLAANDAAFTLDRYAHLMTCQNCAHLSANGRCKVKADYKPIPDAKHDCSRHQITPEARQPVADAPYTPDELNALMRRQEDQLLNHLVHCPDCRISDRRWCADGFAAGSAYDALLMVFDDADDRHQTFVDRVIKARVITGDYPYR